MSKKILTCSLFTLNYLLVCFLLIWISVSSWPEDRIAIAICVFIMALLIVGYKTYYRKLWRGSKEKKKSLGDADKMYLSGFSLLFAFALPPVLLKGFVAIEACYKSEMELVKCLIIVTLALVILNIMFCYVPEHIKGVLDRQESTASERKRSMLIGGAVLVASWGIFFL